MNRKLIKTIRTGQLDKVIDLLEKDPSYKNKDLDNNGWTPLLVAARYDRPDIMKFLLGEGADIDVTNDQGDNASVIAVKYRSHKALRLLAGAGRDINKEHINGDTLLSWAISESDIEMIKLLIELGADVNHVSRYGDTPLIFVFDNFSLESSGIILQLLIDAGADIDYTNDHLFDETALMIAVISGNHIVVNMLLEAGADINKKNKDGKTALELSKGECRKLIKDHISRPKRTMKSKQRLEFMKGSHPRLGEDSSLRHLDGMEDFTTMIDPDSEHYTDVSNKIDDAASNALMADFLNELAKKKNKKKNKKKPLSKKRKKAKKTKKRKKKK